MKISLVTYVITIAILLSMSMAWGKHLIIETKDTANNDLPVIRDYGGFLNSCTLEDEVHEVLLRCSDGCSLCYCVKGKLTLFEPCSSGNALKKEPKPMDMVEWG